MSRDNDALVITLIQERRSMMEEEAKLLRCGGRIQPSPKSLRGGEGWLQDGWPTMSDIVTAIALLFN
jgi:hypothetical protein